MMKWNFCSNVLFRHVNVFSQYTAAVTDASYIATARTFLQEADDYIKAVEQVQKDLKFIDSEFKAIEEERFYSKCDGRI